MMLTERLKYRTLKLDQLKMFVLTNQLRFFFSRYWDCWYLNNVFIGIKIFMPVDCYGILFTEAEGQKLKFEIE